MPNRLWSLVASWLMRSHALADDLGERSAGGVTVLLLGVEGGLHHLVGDVGSQSLHGLLVRLVLPESEER